MENKVLAKVNNKEILQSDFDALIQSIGPQRAMQFQSPEGQTQLLEELINQELFFIEGTEQNVEESDEFKTELEFVKENMIKQITIRNLLSTVEIKDEEVEEFFNANKQMYMQEAAVEASHILVDNEEKANEIVKELEAGKSFEEAATEHSSCPSAQNGGSLGEFTRGKMVPEFENAAFELAVGEVSGVVPTQFGFHIIKVTSKNEAEQGSFEEFKDQVSQTVLLQKQQEKYMAKVEEIKAKVTVEVL